MSTQFRVSQDTLVKAPRLVFSVVNKIENLKTFFTRFSNKKRSASGRFQVALALFAVLFLVSCQKEEISSPVVNSTTADASLADAKKVSKADAGPNVRVIYPASTSAQLNGGTADAKSQVSFEWTQVSGSTSAVIEQPTSSSTAVSNLKPGLYTFVLTATDADGAVRRDSTSITVLQQMTWTIEGTTREALVYLPTERSGRTPIIFAFHGHGGSAKGFSEKGFEVSWPEAIVVYPQGLPTTSNGDPQGKNNGWQHAVGEVNNHTNVQDQDLKFFDAMLSTFKDNFHANPNLVFVHGWSNGGEFVYNVLWVARANELAALAPAAASLGTTNGKQPLPVIHTAGTKDDKVSFKRQQRDVQNVRTLDQCATNGYTCACGSNGLLGTHYDSKINTPDVFLQYDGGHAYPFTVPPVIVNFFKEVAGNKNL